MYETISLTTDEWNLVMDSLTELGDYIEDYHAGELDLEYKKTIHDLEALNHTIYEKLSRIRVQRAEDAKKVEKPGAFEF